MRHALVVGGTGMLSQVSIWLVNEGYNVSVIGRSPERMNQLISATKVTSRITPLLVDYENENELKEQLNMALKKHGPIDLVVAWIHSVGKNALEVISHELESDNHTWKLFHVLGSSSNLKEIKNKAPVPNNCLYKQVQLGFIMEDSNSRWLTNEEISAGVIEAISNNYSKTIVGTLDPWEKRP